MMVLLFLLLGLASLGNAATLPSRDVNVGILEWTCDADGEPIVNYKTYCGPQPGVYTTRVATWPPQTTSILAKDATGGAGTFYCIAHVVTAETEETDCDEVGFILTQAGGDTTLPTTVITAPANGARPKRNQVTTIRANAADNIGVTRVEFYVNGTLMHTDKAAAYTYNWPVPSPANVTYQLQTKAYDAANNVGVSVIITVRSR